MHNFHTMHLRHALQLAQEKRGSCAPNPSVGVVIVKNQQVISTGYHGGVGEIHAEAAAFQSLSMEEAIDSTVYVTLEPCCHQGRTSPCTLLLIARRVREVYYGFLDPNPLVSGKGKEQLEMAGIPCIHFFLPEINDFYESYLHWMVTQYPWVTAKLALSLDGKIAGIGGKRVPITNDIAQSFTHQHRKQSDAILTTVKTVIKDDPQFNVRLKNEPIQKKTVYVLDKHLCLPLHIKLFQTAEKINIFHQHAVDEKKRAVLESKGVRCLAIDLKENQLDMTVILKQMAQDGMHDVLLEAGGTCFESFLLEKKVHRAFIYIALTWLGPQAQSAFPHITTIFNEIHRVKWHILGKDVAGEFKLDFQI